MNGSLRANAYLLVRIAQREEGEEARLARNVASQQASRLV
jgi:hypothetical protein